MRDRGHVYICEFDNGMVKIGMSARNPEGRIKEHKKRMSCTGAKIVNTYISPVVFNYEAIEQEMMEIISGNLTSESKEWAQGISLESIVDKISDSIYSEKCNPDWESYYNYISGYSEAAYGIQIADLKTRLSMEVAGNIIARLSIPKDKQEKAKIAAAVGMSAFEKLGAEYMAKDIARFFLADSDVYSDYHYSQVLFNMIENAEVLAYKINKGVVCL